MAGLVKRFASDCGTGQVCLQEQLGLDRNPLGADSNRISKKPAQGRPMSQS